MNSEYLNKLISEELFVDLQLDRFNESSYAFILKASEEFVLLENYKDDGEYNGIKVYRREDITRIRWGGNDISNTAQLVKRKKFNRIDSINLASKPEAIESISGLFGYITIHPIDFDDNTCFIGEIEHIDEDSLVLHEYGTLGTFDRKYLMIEVSEIGIIEADGVYERNLIALFNK